MNVKNLLTKMMAVCCLIIFASSITAKDIHVATTGNDANEGSESAPLLTIHKAIEMIGSQSLNIAKDTKMICMN